LDLVPLLSQFLLRGKCRYCGAKFSWRYFGVELLTGVLFLLVGLQPGYMSPGGFSAIFIGDPALLLRDLILMSTLVAVSFVDYDTFLIQIDSVFLMGFAGLAYAAWDWCGHRNIYQYALTDGKQLSFLLPAPVPDVILAMVFIGGFFWFIRFIFQMIYGREALGYGDILLASAIGTYLGWNATLLYFVFFSVFLGAAVGVSIQIPRAVRAYKWAKRRFARYGGRDYGKALARHAFRKGMPFGPMLAIGAVVALLWGKPIDNWYANLGRVPPPPAPVFAPPPAIQPYQFRVPPGQ
jgi:leader peptidase (prepilin peptidase)/N-methyltransferase